MNELTTLGGIPKTVLFMACALVYACRMAETKITTIGKLQIFAPKPKTRRLIIKD